MDNKKPTRGFPQVGCDDARDNRHYSPEMLPLVVVKEVACVDSRIIAGQLGTKHKNTFELILKFESEFQELNHLLFKTAVGKRVQGGGNAERFALLSEDQAFLLLALSRNSKRVVRLKLKLVQAFRQARDAVEIAKDYLPGYHQLQNEAKHLAEVAHAAGSTTPERTFHINVNRLVNNACGVEPGQRASLTLQQRIAVTSAGFVAQKAIARALDAGADHHEAYAMAKAQVQRYASGAALLLGV
ncbi:MAG: Rha family transcriptional regulator [Gammaproteobacteria bacterium]|nr:Rha family transcriptional regulator [Gammaproteobacteria bacterium]MBU1979592.1 Rha family transcriptional regulator [Gammaproteobacteria bacterium]